MVCVLLARFGNVLVFRRLEPCIIVARKIEMLIK